MFCHLCLGVVAAGFRAVLRVVRRRGPSDPHFPPIAHAYSLPTLSLSCARPRLIGVPGVAQGAFGLPVFGGAGVVESMVAALRWLLRHLDEEVRCADVMWHDAIGYDVL
jgi:hypothetical protein